MLKTRDRWSACCAVLLLSLSSSVAEARDRYKGAGIQGALVVGARRTDWGDLPDQLSASGYQELAHVAPTFGVLFGFIGGRFRGDVLFEYSTQSVDQVVGSADTNVDQFLLGFDVGYHVLERRYWAVFPTLGVALLNQYVMPMPNVRPLTGWSRDTTQQWGVLGFGLGSEFVVLDTSPKLVLGLRAGYLLPLDHGPWIDTEEAAESGGPTSLDGPVADPGGPYLKLTIGATFGG